MKPLALLARSAPFLTAIRFVVGALFIYAGLAKVMDPHAFLHAILSFRILPLTLAGPMAILLPPLEIVAGAAWALNRWPRSAAFIICALTTLFLGALALALARGVPAECGCFAGLGAGATSLPAALLRDIVLLAATVWWLFAESPPLSARKATV